MNDILSQNKQNPYVRVSENHTLNKCFDYNYARSYCLVGCLWPLLFLQSESGHIHEMLPREYLDFVQREMEIGKLAQKGSQDGKNLVTGLMVSVLQSLFHKLIVQVRCRGREGHSELEGHSQANSSCLTGERLYYRARIHSLLQKA